jgi:hypothetical protein
VAERFGITKKYNAQLGTIGTSGTFTAVQGMSAANFVNYNSNAAVINNFTFNNTAYFTTTGTVTTQTNGPGITGTTLKFNSGAQATVTFDFVPQNSVAAPAQPNSANPYTVFLQSFIVAIPRALGSPGGIVAVFIPGIQGATGCAGVTISNTSTTGQIGAAQANASGGIIASTGLNTISAATASNPGSDGGLDNVVLASLYYIVNTTTGVEVCGIAFSNPFDPNALIFIQNALNNYPTAFPSPPAGVLASLSTQFSMTAGEVVPPEFTISVTGDTTGSPVFVQ